MNTIVIMSTILKSTKAKIILAVKSNKKVEQIPYTIILRHADSPEFSCQKNVEHLAKKEDTSCFQMSSRNTFPRRVLWHESLTVLRDVKVVKKLFDGFTWVFFGLFWF